MFDLGVGLKIAMKMLVKEVKKGITEGKVVLSSECPGWVAYAEKVAGSKIIPFMSTIKSP